jgi:hypothetical protein
MEDQAAATMDELLSPFSEHRGSGTSKKLH